MDENLFNLINEPTNNVAINSGNLTLIPQVLKHNVMFEALKLSFYPAIDQKFISPRASQLISTLITYNFDEFIKDERNIKELDSFITSENSKDLILAQNFQNIILSSIKISNGIILELLPTFKANIFYKLSNPIFYLLATNLIPQYIEKFSSENISYLDIISSQYRHVFNSLRLTFQILQRVDNFDNFTAWAIPLFDVANDVQMDTMSRLRAFKCLTFLRDYISPDQLSRLDFDSLSYSLKGAALEAFPSFLQNSVKYIPNFGKAPTLGQQFLKHLSEFGSELEKFCFENNVEEIVLNSYQENNHSNPFVYSIAFLINPFCRSKEWKTFFSNHVSTRLKRESSFAEKKQNCIIRKNDFKGCITVDNNPFWGMASAQTFFDREQTSKYCLC